ncbi:MAG: hypothetical protein ACYDBJ_14075 [Aggregatilineales bacterium]
MPETNDGKPIDDVSTKGQNEPEREVFYHQVRSLHEQFMRGEFSQGYMAAELGIARIDLIHLLETMGLPVTNV